MKIIWSRFSDVNLLQTTFKYQKNSLVQNRTDHHPQARFLFQGWLLADTPQLIR